MERGGYGDGRVLAMVADERVWDLHWDGWARGKVKGFGILAKAGKIICPRIFLALHVVFHPMEGGITGG